MKFTRRIRYQCNTSIGDSEVTENVEIKDNFDFDLHLERPSAIDSISKIAQDLIQEIKKEVPCVESESSSTE